MAHSRGSTPLGLGDWLFAEGVVRASGNAPEPGTRPVRFRL